MLALLNINKNPRHLFCRWLHSKYDKNNVVLVNQNCMIKGWKGNEDNHDDDDVHRILMLIEYSTAGKKTKTWFSCRIVPNSFLFSLVGVCRHVLRAHGAYIFQKIIHDAYMNIHTYNVAYYNVGVGCVRVLPVYIFQRRSVYCMLNILVWFCYKAGSR